MNTQKYHVFLDMDGVFADFDRHILDLTGKRPADFTRKSDMWDIVKRIMENGQQFFGALQPMADAHILWNGVKNHPITFLTATGHIHPEAVDSQKRQWVHRHFGDQHVITVRKSADKQKYVIPDTVSILIDDRSKSIDPWIEAGGIGILHKKAVDSVKQLDEIISALQGDENNDNVV